MLVKSIDIKEFRGIRRLVKPLELAKFTVLLGRNNVGKTSILESLYLLTTPYESPLSPYGNSPISLIGELHGGSSSLVYGYSGKTYITYRLASRVKFDERSIDRVEFAINDRGIAETYLDGEKLSLGIPSERYRNFIEVFGCGFDKDLVALYIPNHTSYYDKLRDFALKEEVVRWVEKQGLHKKVAEKFISRTVYDRFTEVLVRKDRLCLRKEVSGGIGPLYVDMDSLGEGVRRFTLIYLATEYLNPKILLWDDIEVAMHPGLLELVVKWLVESGRQVVVSTHSIDLLYTLTIEKPSNIKVVVLRKREDDTIEHQSLTLDELEEMLGASIDLRKIVDELQL